MMSLSSNNNNKYKPTKMVEVNTELQNIKDKVKQYYLYAYELYQKLFELINTQDAYYSKPEELRHPLIFYYGHTACFYMNKFLYKGIISKGVNEQFQRVFAVGVDEMDWDDIDQKHYDWPSVKYAKDYRNQVKQKVLEIIEKTEETKITWQSDLWVVIMGIQHELLHVQTSAVIMRQLPIQHLKSTEWYKQCPFKETDILKVPQNQMKKVPKCAHSRQTSTRTTTAYMWDNQVGSKEIKINQFEASSMLVSNKQFLEFINQKGYQQPQFWSEQGKKWINSKKVKHPIFWRVNNQNVEQVTYQLKTIVNVISMPWDWPVQVNHLQASAFCKWKSQKLGKKLRLPTESEYQAIWFNTSKFNNENKGNINLKNWISPCPVNTFKMGQFFDVFGNLWQHTKTPMYPLKGFTVHESYEDYSISTFDNKHDILKGGSFISSGSSALFSFRNYFRRHFYQFAGFRYVQSNNEQDSQLNHTQQIDECAQKQLRIHYKDKNSYIQQSIRVINSIKPKLMLNKALVIGCSVGRLPLQLSRSFKEVFGTDYTSRLFLNAVELIEKQKVQCGQIQVFLKDLSLDQSTRDKVLFYQMFLENIDEKKINNIDFLIIDSSSLKPNTIDRVVRNSISILNHQSQVTMMIISDKNNRQFDHKGSINSLQYQLILQQMKMSVNKTSEMKERQIEYHIFNVQFK